MCRYDLKNNNKMGISRVWAPLDSCVAIVAIVGMVLVTMRAVRGGVVLIKSARPIDEQEALNVTVNRFLERCPDGFELQSVEVFKDDA